MGESHSKNRLEKGDSKESQASRIENQDAVARVAMRDERTILCEMAAAARSYNDVSREHYHAYSRGLALGEELAEVRQALAADPVRGGLAACPHDHTIAHPAVLKYRNGERLCLVCGAVTAMRDSADSEAVRDAGEAEPTIEEPGVVGEMAELHRRRKTEAEGNTDQHD